MSISKWAYWADTCDDCRYAHKKEYEIPCVDCKHSHKDMYERG